MRTPQSGIFALGTAADSYLEFRLAPGANPREMMRIIADLRGPRATTGGVNLVAGFAPSLWAAVSRGDSPAGIHDFTQPVVGVDGYTIPATQRDLWLWAAGHAYDRVFDTAREAISALSGVAQLGEETAGWTYKDSRDLIGFIDGSANPSLSEAPELVLIPEGQPGALGTVLLFQKWLHEADQWDALSVEQQERVVGRTKLESRELAADVMPEDSHVSRTTVLEEGMERKIFRRNTPYGTVVEHGTVFIGFSAEQRLLETMLERMAGVGDGIRDALTSYTRALTGAYYFIPSVESLRSCGSEG